MPIDRLARYGVRVDWDQDGDFDGAYDDVIADTLAEPGISITRGRDQARAAGSAQVASADWTLDNRHRRYSVEFVGSPLYAKLLPGRPCNIQGQFGEDVLMDDPDALMDDPDALMEGRPTVDLFTGVLDELDQAPALGQRTVSIRALGSLMKLRGQRITTPLYENITTGQAVVYALEAAGLTSDEYDVDADMIANGRMLAYWYADDDDAYEVVVGLVLHTEGYSAASYERGGGVIAIEGRNYRTLQARCQTTQATFWDVSLIDSAATMDDADVLMDDPAVYMDGATSGLFHTSLRAVPGIRDVCNVATAEVVVRTAASLGVVWTYGATVTLDGDGAASVTARPTNPFKSAVTPAVSTDFTLSVGSVTVALSQTSGGSTRISFSGGTAGATISGLQLRAVALEETATARVTSSVDVSSSQTKYGVRSKQLTPWAGLTPAEAQSLADAWVTAYAEPRPLVDVEIVNADGAHTQQIMTREVSDRIRLIDRQSGIDMDVLIETITHRVGQGRVHTLALGCEKIVEQDWGLWDVGLWDTALWGQ